MAKNSDKCPLFILSYNRADNVRTLKALRDSNYSGDWYLIVGQDDPQIAEYIKRYGDKVLVFNKADYRWTDLIDNDIERINTVVFARNAVYDIAERIGVTYFIVLDDDYESFGKTINSNLIYKSKKIKDINKFIALLLDFYKKTPTDILAIAQAGDFVGGVGAVQKYLYKRLPRKTMNFFLCSTERRVEFIGRLNDDVNTYVYWGTRGKIFLTTFYLRLMQALTQTQSGGLTDAYLDLGTYQKSFSTVVICPSAVTVGTMGYKERRYHHHINWNLTVPKILRPDV